MTTSWIATCSVAAPGPSVPVSRAGARLLLAALAAWPIGCWLLG